MDTPIPTRRVAVVTHLAVFALGVALGALVVYAVDYSRHAIWWKQIQQRATQAFKLARKAENTTPSSRRGAAAHVATRKGGESWAIVILLDQEALGDGAACLPEGIRAPLENAPTAVVASLLQNIPSCASDALLWAVTYRLSDDRKGWYSTHPIFPWPAHALHITEPLQDLAREALVRALGVDHGYDAEAWRETILKREKE